MEVLNSLVQVQPKDMSNSEKESIRKVFSCDLIRHKIFSYVMWYTNDGHFGNGGPKQHYLNKDNVLSLRSVCKTWLWSVTYLLRKYKEPLTHLDLTLTDSGKPTSHSCFARFIQAFGFSEPIWVDGEHGYCGLPPFALFVFTSFFKDTKYREVAKDFFNKFGNGLVKLRLFILCDKMSGEGDDYCREMFELETLPILESVSIQLCRHDESQPPIITSSMSLLQEIILAAENLKKLYIRGSLDPYFTEEFANKVILPVTQQKRVAQFHMDCSVNQVVNFEKNILFGGGSMTYVNLTSLRLYAFSAAFDEDSLFRILTGVRHSLRVLQLDGDNDSGLSIPRNERSYLKFPQRMSKLLTLRVLSNEWHPLIRGPGRLAVWQPPKSMKSMQFDQIAESVFDRWTKNSNHKRWEHVDRLNLYLLQNNWQKKVLALSENKMQGIHYAFPNVAHLTVSMSGTELDGFKYIFREMRNLQTLHINIMIGYLNDNDMILIGQPETMHIYSESTYWDAMFIGASTKLIKELNKKRRMKPEDRESMMDRLSKEESIRNLVNLKSLYLKTGDYLMYEAVTIRPCILSELAFEYGFERMANLRELELRGNFRSASEVEARLKKFHERKGQETEFKSRTQRMDPVVRDAYAWSWEGWLITLEFMIFTVASSYFFNTIYMQGK